MKPAWEKSEAERALHHGGNLAGGILIAAGAFNVAMWAAQQEWPEPLSPVFKWAAIAVLFGISGFSVLFALSAAWNWHLSSDEEREQYERGLAKEARRK